jgi:single-strand DNA-binding protein
MYLNSVTLTGFLGADAERRTAKDETAYVILNLATKTSWKDRETGDWSSRTDWHRCIVFGRLAETAAKLTKGTHVQVQGQLRNREYQKDDGKQRTTEIRVTALSKLDRPGRRGAVNPDDTTGNPEVRS